MPPDEPNDEETLEELPEDGATPFSAPDPSRDDPADDNLTRELEETKSDDTYPTTDVKVEDEEYYQQGIDTPEPNAGNAVEGYDSNNDQRRKSADSN